MKTKLAKKITLLELDLAEKCENRISCGRCPTKQDCDTYKNLFYLVNRVSEVSNSKTIRVWYDPTNKEELHVCVKKEDFDDLVARANKGGV
jgi:hypothetical protein